MRKSFDEIFNDIIYMIRELDSNFKMYDLSMMYNHPMYKRTRSDYATLCEASREKLIDYVTMVAIDYQCEMKDPLQILVGDNVDQDGYEKYKNYTLEEFFNKIINHSYEIHNIIIMHTWFATLGLQINSK